MRSVLLFACWALVASSPAVGPFKPSAEELRASYTRANTFQTRALGACLNLTLTPHWNQGNLWYAKQEPGGRMAYVFVDTTTGVKRPLFDEAALYKALGTKLGKSVDPDKVKLEAVQLSDSGENILFRLDGTGYAFNLKTNVLSTADVPEANGTERGQGRRRRQGGGAPRASREGSSPDGARTARIQDGNVQVRTGEGEWQTLTKEGSFETFTWSDDSQHLIALHCLPGDRKKIYWLHATGDGKTRATLEEQLYDQPGDKLDTYESYILDAKSGTETKLDWETVDGGAYPYHSAPGVRVWRGQFVMDYPERGDQEYKVVAIDPTTAKARAIVDEKMNTFVDISRSESVFMEKTPELMFRSERDGWARLYLYDANTGEVKNAVTPTGGVFRQVLRVDEGRRVLWFSASGLTPGEDPYYIHYYKVNFDGSGLTPLTPGDGTHTVQLSPDSSLLVDTYSRVDAAPVHVLRRMEDGSLVSELEKADIAQLQRNGVRLPERFVAKGRDGKTDIYGVVIKPTNFDPRKSYPIIENIYAGPQDSFVPKAFAPFFNMTRLAELGFIVVQIDGMGTANRGKAFHDVCWHNIADAGFPDRILWMKAMAKAIPQADIDRVGVYGTSAGGQNACGAVLWHPEFYKVAVASCGCHDNSIDKQWWNEQWMGYPKGPWYAEQSNANNVDKLKGHLFLFVGEDDHNVPPETSIRLLDAFMKANKDVDFLMIPGADHTDGGPYGEHKRRDFFVRWLLGVNPPDWNNN